MNKRIKKKLIEKHGYKRYRSEMYRYIRSWIVASKRYTILGIPDPDQMKYSKDNFIPYEPEPENGANGCG